MSNFTKLLISEGWLTPQSYGNHFGEPPDEPGLYILMKVDLDLPTMPEHVMYAGMSRRLARRLSGHPVRREIARDSYVQTWFKSLSIDLPTLRREETDLIRRFRPPYNVIGRVRGEEWAART